MSINIVKLFKHLYFKRGIAIILFFIFIETIFISTAYFIEEREIDRRLNIATKHVDNYTKVVVDDLIKQANILHELLVNSSYRMKEIMLTASNAIQLDKIRSLREDMRHLYNKIYSYLSRKGVGIFSFYLPGGVRFLYFYNSYNGDNFLAEVWDKLRSSRGEIHGYEIGLNMAAFRNIYPILKQNNFLGSVELSYLFVTIQQLLMSKDNAVYTFLINGEKTTFFNWPNKNYSYSEFPNFLYDTKVLNNSSFLSKNSIKDINSNITKRVIGRIKRGDSFSILYRGDKALANKTFIITFIPIRGFKGDLIGYIVSYRLDYTISLLKNNFIIIYALLTILAFIISIILGLTLFNKQN